MNLVQWFADPANWQGADGVPAQVGVHLAYSFISALVACAIGLPVGLAIGHTGRGAFLIGALTNSLRALPTLGLLTLLVVVMAPLFTSDLAFVVPSLAVLVVLAVPPVLVNAYAGVHGVDPAARDAARGMGMTGLQTLVRVEIPCALPLIISGIRSAVLQIVSTATVAAYVSLGGLGRYLIDGQAQNDYTQMSAGAVLVAALAIALELLLLGVQRWASSPGVTRRARRRRAPATVPRPSPAAG